jgi:WD40 repeat protein
MGGVRGGVFAADGQRVLSWGSDGTARVWSAATGPEIARQTHGKAFSSPVFAADGERVLSWGEDGTARVSDVSWSVPRASNMTLISEVCERKLRGLDVVVRSPIVNGRSERLSHVSIRRITDADADFAPLLRDAVGEDVCSPTTFSAPSLASPGRLFRLRGR